MSSGLSFTAALGLLFIGLKLGNVIDWSWTWVLAPFWIPFLIGLVIVLILLIGRVAPRKPVPLQGVNMRYSEFRRHVWMLWREARHLDPIDKDYRAWIVARTVERVLEAHVTHDNAPGELGLHLLHDFRDQFNPTERLRFAFWWQHVMEKGFNGDNPMKHLHKKQAVKV